jgi:hypothetical protein
MVSAPANGPLSRRCDFPGRVALIWDRTTRLPAPTLPIPPAGIGTGHQREADARNKTVDKPGQQPEDQDDT